MKDSKIKTYWLEQSAKANMLGHEFYVNCDSHAFAGKVVDVELDQYLVFEGCKWVFSTGELSAKAWDTAEKIPNPGGYWRVAISKIESFGDLVKKL